MKLLLKLLVLNILFILVLTNPIEPKKSKKDKEWWQTAVFYQIYPRSFQDSDGDGNGDLNGISARLEHLKNIGVTAAWLSPIYKSPMVDGGYDIADFKDIDPIFGNMTDFENLLALAKKLGIRIVLDFVPNHSSDKHEWFEKSIKRIDPYTNYYVWADGKIVNGKRQPPSNWVSEFHGSAWEWNEERGQYYLHQFAKAQPDLNYRDPYLVEEMKNVLRFWMDKGVSGFRVDTIPSLFEVETFPDEPLSGDPNCPPTDYCYLNHIYTKDQPLTFDMVVQWRDVLKEHAAIHGGEPRVIMTEAYSPIDTVMGYYGNATHDGACFTFNFFIIMNANSGSNAEDFKKIIDMWMEHLPEGRTPNWVLGNHDQHRVATRLGKEKIDALNMMTMTLPGVGVTYNGEEIGQEDGFVSWEDTQDPNAINAGKDRYLNFTRDPERTPMQWDNTKNAGFSTANKTWLPVSDKYLETNVKKQVLSHESHYYVYKSLIDLRQKKTLIEGSLKTSAPTKNVLTILRELKGNKSILAVLNFGSEREEVDLRQFASAFGKELVVEVASVGAQITQGSIIPKGVLTLNPYESYVISG